MNALLEPGLALRLARDLDAIVALPVAVQRHASLSLLNVMGCVLAGAHHPAMGMARRAVLKAADGRASVFGLVQGADPLQAAWLNASAAAVHSFDDTHADSLVHPGGPVAFALLALAQVHRLGGAQFLHAFALGVELACRLSKALSCPPAVAEPGWVQNGVSTGAGAALACAKALGLGPAPMADAMGVALSAAAGVRALSRGMCFSLMSGQSAEAGLRAAWLAQQGFASAPAVLEADDGVLAMHSRQPHAPHLLAELGQRFELMDNLAKPYPCGVVLHAAIDAALEAAARGVRPEQVRAITLRLAPATVRLADLPQPQTPEQAAMSVQHWVAIGLCDGRAALAQTDPTRLQDPRLAELRARMQLQADPTLSRESAQLELALTGGGQVQLHIAHCRGSRGRPMSEDEVIAKFRMQCEGVLTSTHCEQLLQRCLGVAGLDDAGELVRLATRGQE